MYTYESAYFHTKYRYGMADKSKQIIPIINISTIDWEPYEYD